MNIVLQLNRFALLVLAVILLVLFFEYLPGRSPQLLSLNYKHDLLVNYQHLVFNSSLNWPTHLFAFDQHQQITSQHNLKLIIMILAISIMLITNYLSSTTFNRIDQTSIFLSFIGPIILYYFFGYDVVIFTITLFTLLNSVLIYKALTETKNENFWYFLGILAITATILTTSILCSIPIVLGICLACVLKSESFKYYPILRTKNDYLFIYFILIILVVGLVFVNWPIVPDYSALGRVVEDDGLPGNILPLFSPTPNIPIIDRQLIHALFSDLSSWLLVLAILLYLLSRSILGKFCFLTNFLVWLDIFTVPNISQIAPIACIERLVPGLIYFPLGVTLLAFNVLLIILVIRQCTNLLLVAGLFAMLIPAMSSYQHIVKSKQPIVAGIYIPSSSANAHKELEQMPNDFVASNLKYLFSPSYAVLNKAGLWPLSVTDVIQQARFSSLFKEQPTIIASSNQALAPNMIDRNMSTRWSHGNGVQAGNEWIYLNFSTPINISGLELETGHLHTDFARGLEVWVGNTCPAVPEVTNPERSGFTQIASHPNWDGPIVMTAKGFPYFGPQGVGKIYFRSPVQPSCLLVKQVGQSKHFDWSVLEIRLLKNVN